MKRNRESGQALVFVAVGLVVLIGFVGLGIDMGVLRFQRRVQQNAADAAAIAEANDLGYSGINTTAAQSAVANNGFAGATVNFNQACPSSVTELTVTVNNPPQSGPHQAGTANAANYVEVCVATLQPTYFTRIFGVNNEVVNARAVATNYAGTTNGNNNYNCLITLGPPNASIEGVNINGAATLNAPTCGIADNGNYNTVGNKLIVDAGSFGVSGTANVKGGGGTVTCTSGQTNCPQDGVPAVKDPLFGTVPPCSPCAVGTPITISGGGGYTGTGVSYNSSTGVYTIQPGTYSGIYIKGTSASSVNFAPGTYIIDGTSGCNAGCISIPGNSTVTGTDVFFYFTNAATFQTNGTPHIVLSAPTTGTYKDILMYQDPSDTNVGPAPNGPTLGGDNTSSYNGVLYFPNDEVTLYGNNTTSGSGLAIGALVSKSIALSGSPVLNLEGKAGMPGGSMPPAFTLANATLVE